MYTNLPTSQGYIFRILQHFATKVCSFSNFDNFFPKISFVIPRLKIFLKRKSSIDEATSNAKDSCLVVYVRSIINGLAVDIFLSINELGGQDANSIYESLLDSLKSNGIKDEYLAKNIIAFTSGASMMTGQSRGSRRYLSRSIRKLFCGIVSITD